MAVVEPLVARLFRTRDGAPLGRLPFTDVSWQEGLNEAGSITTTVGWSSLAGSLDLRQVLRPWYTSVALTRGTHVVAAGPVTRRSWDGSALKVTAGGGWTLMGARLVLDHALASFTSRIVLVDEENPAGAWELTLTGSTANIARGLVAEALKWGPLPIDLPAVEAGSDERTYLGWDMATVAERLSDLTEEDPGIEIAFRPYLTEAGFLRWQMQADTELISLVHEWSTLAPGQRVQWVSLDEDGADMVTDVWSLGGKSDDKLLVSRQSSASLTGAGWPVLQVADTSHSTLMSLGGLNLVGSETLARGSRFQEVHKLRVGHERVVHAGDWVNLRVRDQFFGETLLPLKVTGVSGSTSEWLDVECVLRGDE